MKKCSKCFDKDYAIRRINDIISQTGITELPDRFEDMIKKEEKKFKKKNKCSGFKKFIIVVAVIAVIAGAGYLFYKYKHPDYLEDFDDDVDEEDE